MRRLAELHPSCLSSVRLAWRRRRSCSGAGSPNPTSARRHISVQKRKSGKFNEELYGKSQREKGPSARPAQRATFGLGPPPSAAIGRRAGAAAAAAPCSGERQFARREYTRERDPPHTQAQCCSPRQRHRCERREGGRRRSIDGNGLWARGRFVLSPSFEGDTQRYRLACGALLTVESHGRCVLVGRCDSNDLQRSGRPGGGSEPRWVAVLIGVSTTESGVRIGGVAALEAARTLHADGRRSLRSLNSSFAPLGCTSSSNSPLHVRGGNVSDRVAVVELPGKRLGRIRATPPAGLGWRSWDR
jgi:hypothetical protein